MKEAWEEFEQLTRARFSSSRLRLVTSSVTVMETERTLEVLIRVVSEMVPMLSSSRATWNVETGSKENVPGPVLEKSYMAETEEGIWLNQGRECGHCFGGLTVVFGGHGLTGRDCHPIILREVGERNRNLRGTANVSFG